jgi:glycosyltransferase involved in cell wall biosynthesis
LKIRGSGSNFYVQRNKIIFVHFFDEMINKLSVIIPVYNEEKTIRAILEKVRDTALVQDIAKEIIIINDASSDGSGEEIEAFLKDNPDLDCKANVHEINQGKGGAIHTGIHLATGEYLIIQDADLELDPTEYNLLLQPVLDGTADVVYGSRFLGKNKTNESFLHRVANSFLTWLSNFVFRVKLTDMETCYKLIETATFKEIPLKEKRFGFEPEITAKLAKVKGIRFTEVPITYVARSNEQGKKIGWTDGFRAIWCILKYGWFTRRKKK